MRQALKSASGSVLTREKTIFLGFPGDIDRDALKAADGLPQPRTWCYKISFQCGLKVEIMFYICRRIYNEKKNSKFIDETSSFFFQLSCTESEVPDDINGYYALAGSNETENSFLRKATMLNLQILFCRFVCF